MPDPRNLLICLLDYLFGCSILAFCLFSAQGGAAHAQQAAVVPEPHFEVASIRPSPESQTPCWSQIPPGTHYIVTCVPLRVLIAQA